MDFSFKLATFVVGLGKIARDVRFPPSFLSPLPLPVVGVKRTPLLSFGNIGVMMERSFSWWRR